MGHHIHAERPYWLIERWIRNELHYWAGGCADHRQSFATNVDDAIRFVREADAMRVLFRLCEGEGRVAQHQTMATPSPTGGTENE